MVTGRSRTVAMNAWFLDRATEQARRRRLSGFLPPGGPRRGMALGRCWINHDSLRRQWRDLRTSVPGPWSHRRDRCLRRYVQKPNLPDLGTGSGDPRTDRRAAPTLLASSCVPLPSSRTTRFMTTTAVCPDSRDQRQRRDHRLYVESRAWCKPLILNRSPATTSNGKRQRDLPNLIYTSGTEWRLYRDSHPSGTPNHSGGTPACGGSKLSCGDDFR